MDSTLIYALIAGVALVILAVILKAALRLAFKVFAVMLVLMAIAVGTWLWFNRPDRQSQHEPRPTPTRRATPAQH
jgi:DMSO reductase anchor subunit